MKIFISMALILTTYLFYIFVSVPNIDFSEKCVLSKKAKNKLCSDNPDFVEHENLSEHIINAVLVAEDISFFQHGGFNLYEIKESFFTNLKRFRLARGGSTITQQMIKNVYLSPEKTLSRKIHEAILTLKVEDQLSKERILAMYFNAVEFGPDLYGIKAASKYYFNKQAEELNILESAFLAFLLPSPRVYNSSYENRELTKFANERLNDIIGKMHFYKKISEYQRDLATNLILQFPWQNLSYDQKFELLEKHNDE